LHNQWTCRKKRQDWYKNKKKEKRTCVDVFTIIEGLVVFRTWIWCLFPLPLGVAFKEKAKGRESQERTIQLRRMGSKRRRNSENCDYGVVRTGKELNFNFNIS
jgi:hypothetical protein